VIRTRTSPTIAIAGLVEKSTPQCPLGTEATAFMPREVHHGAA
jgi:hypothetical protein